MDLPTADEPVKLIQGDCLDVLRSLPDAAFDAVITDPPYGVGFEYGTDYDDAEDNYRGVIDRVLSAERLVRPGGFVAVYQAAVHARRWAEWFPREWQLISMPKTFVQSGRGDLVPATDYVLWWRHGDGGPKPRSWQQGMARDWFLCDTLPANRDDLSKGHPCPRPLPAVRYLVRSLCPPGGLVCDPFAGSGTTGKASVMEGRRAVLIEREPAYCDIIRKRLAHASGTAPGSLFAGVTA